MDDFNQLYPVLRALPARELAIMMSQVDEVISSHLPCISCASKALAYAILFTRGKIPKMAAVNTRRYQATSLKYPTHLDDLPRDFMAEVHASLERQVGCPVEERHKRVWRNYAASITLSRPLSGG